MNRSIYPRQFFHRHRHYSPVIALTMLTLGSSACTQIEVPEDATDEEIEAALVEEDLRDASEWAVSDEGVTSQLEQVESVGEGHHQVEDLDPPETAERVGQWQKIDLDLVGYDEWGQPHTLAELTERVRLPDETTAHRNQARLNAISNSIMSKLIFDYTLLPGLNKLIPPSTDVVNLSRASLEAIANIVGEQLNSHWLSRDSDLVDSIADRVKKYNRLVGSQLISSYNRAIKYRDDADTVGKNLRAYGKQGTEAHILAASLSNAMQREAYHLVGLLPDQPQSVVDKEYTNMLEALDDQATAMQGFYDDARRWSDSRFGNPSMEDWVDFQTCGRIFCKTTTAYRACFGSPDGKVCTETNYCINNEPSPVTCGKPRQQLIDEANALRDSLAQQAFDADRDKILGVDYQAAVDAFSNFRSWFIYNCEGDHKCKNGIYEVLVENFDDAAVLERSPNANFGADDELLVDSSSFKASYIKLRDLGGIPPNVDIQSASLRFRSTNMGDSVEFYEVTSPWDEHSITFNNRPSSGDYQGRMSTDDWWDMFPSINLTNIVKDWYEGRRANHGLLMWPTGSDGVDLVSSEGFLFDRPVLTVTYKYR